jgi:CheY-like chemotaxis protein
MKTLCGLRVLVVEDEPLLLLAMEDILVDLGCEVVGKAARLEPALKLARELVFDFAVLDINLDGTRVDPVADTIVGRGLPVVFLTGYSGEFEGRPAHGPVIEKPCDPAVLRGAMRRALEISSG